MSFDALETIFSREPHLFLWTALEGHQSCMGNVAVVQMIPAMGAADGQGVQGMRGGEIAGGKGIFAWKRWLNAEVCVCCWCVLISQGFTEIKQDQGARSSFVTRTIT